MAGNPITEEQGLVMDAALQRLGIRDLPQDEAQKAIDHARTILIREGGGAAGPEALIDKALLFIYERREQAGGSVKLPKYRKVYSRKKSKRRIYKL